MTTRWITSSLAILVFTWLCTEARAAAFDEMATHSDPIVVAVVQSARVFPNRRAAPGVLMDSMGAAPGGEVHNNSWVKDLVTNSIAGSANTGDVMAVCTGEHVAIGSTYLSFVSTDKDMAHGCSWS